MTLIFPLFLGFLVSAIGITPPGLINMTAAKVSLKDGKNAAMSFVVGAITIVSLQTYLALEFAKFINSRPDIIKMLQEIGVVIFSALTVYFFWAAKKKTKQKEKEIKIRSKTNRFFLGMLLSALNLFPIPYYVFISITLSAYGYFSFEKTAIYTFVSGVVLGSFAVFYCYVLFFKKQEGKQNVFVNNLNLIIGSITGLVALFTVFRLIKNNFF